MADEQLGSAQVEIVASLAPLTRGLAEARTAVEAGTAQMQAGIAQFTASSANLVGGLVGQFQNLIGVLGIGFGLKESIDAIEQNENALARLSAVLQSTGGAIGYSRAELVKMADALQQTSTYSHVEIEQAQGLLLAFTNIGHDVFPKALQATLDLAAATGKDLPAAATQLGRALQDPERGMMLLQRSIGQLSPMQRAAIKNFEDMGNIAGAQGVILDALTVKFGGTADAMRNTLGGAMSSTTHDVEDLIEKFGEGGMSGVLTQDINRLGDFTKTLGGASSAAGSFAAGALTFLGDAFHFVLDSMGGDYESAANEFTATSEDAAKRLQAIFDSAGPGKSTPLHPTDTGPSQEQIAAQQKAQEEFDKTSEAIERQTDDYTRLADAMGLGTNAMREAQTANAIEQELEKAGSNLSGQQVQQIYNEVTAREQQKFALEDEKKALDESNKGQQEQNRQVDEFLKRVEAAHTPMQKLADDIDHLQVLLASGDIDWNEYTAAIANLGTEFGKEDAQAQKTANTMAGEVSSAVARGTSSFLDLSSAMLVGTDAAKKHETAMQQSGKAAAALVQDLMKVVEQLLILNPLENALNSAMGSNKAPLPTANLSGIESGIGTGASAASGMLGDATSWLGKMFTDPAGLFHGLFGASGDAASQSFLDSLTQSAGGTSTANDLFSGLFGTAGLFGFATGGSFDVGGGGGVDSQLVQFKATPGEHVSVGQDRGPSSGAAPMNVYISNNHPNAEVSAGPHPNGRDMMVQIDEAQAFGIRQGSATYRAIRDVGGISRVPIQR